MNPMQPQGLEALMAAMQAGGAPMGNMAQQVNPAVAMAQQGGAPVDPLQSATSGIDPQLLMLIMQALQGGAFNQQAPMM